MNESTKEMVIAREKSKIEERSIKVSSSKVSQTLRVTDQFAKIQVPCRIQIAGKECFQSI